MDLTIAKVLHFNKNRKNYKTAYLDNVGALTDILKNRATQIMLVY